MKPRPKLLTGLAIVDWYLGVCSLYGALAVLSRVPTAADLQAEQHLMMGAILCVLYALAAFLASWGIWRLKRWAKWLAITVLGLAPATLSVDGGLWRREVLVSLVPFAALLALLAAGVANLYKERRMPWVPRPRFLVVLAVLQWLLALMTGNVVMFGLAYMTSEGSGSDFREMAGLILVMLGFLFAGIGIWKEKPWGQWLAITVVVLVIGYFVPAGYPTHHFGGSLQQRLPILLPLSFVLLLHLLPPVWRALRPKLETPAPTI